MGLVLRTPPFSHGQLYVAMSRVSAMKDLCVWQYNAARAADRSVNIEVENIVIKSILE